MSRAFNGGSAADFIAFSSGTMTGHQGPITMAFLAKLSSTVGAPYLIQGTDGTFAKFGQLASGGRLFLEQDFGGGPSVTAGSWYWLVGAKVSGTAAPRWHVKNVTAGTAWSHTDDAGTQGDIGGAPTTTILLGNSASLNAANAWRGSLAVAAVWDTALSDLAVQGACTLLAADTFGAAPKWMVRLNQSNIGTAVTDDTGGGGNQTSLSGTSVDVDDPPGYSYSISVAPPAPPPPAPPVDRSIGWWTLGSIREENAAYAAESRQPPVACPNDGEPLELVHGVLHCRYDGYRWTGWTS